MPKIDLLIMDIDDAFLYHRTVAAANRIFLNTIAGFFGARIREKRLLTTADAFMKSLKVIFYNIHEFRFSKRGFRRFAILSGYAVLLHLLNAARELFNLLGGKMSNKAIIMAWAAAVKKARINEKEYSTDKEVIRKSLYDETKEVFDRIRRANRKMDIAAISENFSLSTRKDPIIRLLDIGFMKSNTLICDKKGDITDYKISIASRDDKKRVAQAIIMKTKAKNIGIIIDDYDDLGLLGIDGLKLVVYAPKIERFIDKKRYCAIRVDV